MQRSMQEVSANDLLKAKQEGRRVVCSVALLKENENMLYCFIEEELAQLPEDDPLCIQDRYAGRLQQLCLYSLRRNMIMDQNNQKLEVMGKRILLRTSCQYLYEGIKAIKIAGGIPAETELDIKKIENWPELSISKRPVLAYSFQELKNSIKLKTVHEILNEWKEVFVKTREKGFSSRISVQRLLQNDDEVMSFLEKHCQKEDILFLAEWMDIKEDSLGKKESRHIVMDGRIINSSRPLHSLKHVVPQSQRYAATELVKQISGREDFPKNYILDLGEFVKDENSFIDIVELNPLTPAMCYVNNSIFENVIPEIQPIFEKTGMGAEYCYDLMKHGERYAMVRRNGENYQYTDEKRYCFI